MSSQLAHFIGEDDDRSGDKYHRQVTALLDEITNSTGGLKGAADVVVRRLPTVLNPRFMSEVLAPLTFEKPSRDEKLSLWITQLAVLQALEGLTVRELGQAGLGLLLLMISMRDNGNIEAFMERHARDLEAEAIDYIIAASDQVRAEPRLSGERTGDLSKGLLQIAELLSRSWGEEIVERPLMLSFFSSDTRAFLRKAIELAAMRVVDEKLPARLNALWRLLSRTDEEEHLMLAICAWTRARALELLSDLPGEEIEILVDVLQYDLRRQLIEEWATKAFEEDRDDAGRFAYTLGTWIAWGMSNEVSPPPPYPTLLKLAELEEAEGLSDLVCEEPYLLQEPVLADLGRGTDLALIPELLFDSEKTVEKARNLYELGTTFSQPANNPLIALIEPYANGTISQADAQEEARAIGRSNPLYVAGAAGDGAREQQGGPAMHEAAAQLVLWAAEAVPHNRLLRAYAASSLAFAALSTRPYNELMALLEDAQRIANELGHPMLRSEVLYNMGQAHQRFRNNSEAWRCYTGAYLACLSLPPPFGRLDALLSLIELAEDAGGGPDRATIRRYLRLLRAYGIENAAPIPAARYWAYWERLHRLDGNSEAADEAAKRLRELEAQLPRLADLRVEGEISKLILLGEYQQAIKVLEEYALRKQRLGEHKAVLNAYQKILTLCEEHNLDKEFIRNFTSYTLAATRVPGVTDSALHFYLEAIFYKMLGAHEQAISLFRTALDALTEYDTPVLRYAILSDMASCYVELDKEEDALETIHLLRRTLGSASTSTPAKSVPPQQLYNFEMHNMTDAGLDQAEGLVFARYARRLTGEGQTEQALKRYRQAQALWERALRREGLTKAFRNGLHNNLRLLAADMAELGRQASDVHVPVGGESYHPGDYEEHVREAVIELERRRNVLLAGLLSLDAIPPGYRRAYREALRSAGQGQEWGRTQPPILGGFGRDQELDTAQRALESIIKRIQEEHPEFRAPDIAGPRTLHEVREALSGLPDTALIYLETRSKGTVALIVSETALELMELPLSLEDVTSLRADFRRDAPRTSGSSAPAAEEGAIHQVAQYSQPALAGTVDEQAETISERVWAKLHPRLQQLGVRQLVLMPDSFLALLPLHSAPLPGAGSEREWLLDRYKVAYSQSAAAFTLCRRRAAERNGQRTAWGALAQGAYAQHAHASMASGVLTRLNSEGWFGEARIVWTRDIGPGRKDVVRTLEGAINGSRLLYVHCHGRFDPARPLEAALRLDTSPPGVLTADQVLDLSSSLGSNGLVLLAVCEGGEVAMQITPDYQGFPLAFLEAGAPIVLAAPWRLNEPATPLLLTRFFEYLAKRDTVAEALRKAQTWLRTASRDELVGELGAMLKQVVGSPVGTGLEVDSARSLIRGAIDLLKFEGKMLVSLLTQIGASGPGEALAILWQAKQAYWLDPASEKARTYARTKEGLRAQALYNLADYLWLSLRDNEDTDLLIERMRRLLEHPFASPYYWGGLQAIGAGFETA